MRLTTWIAAAAAIAGAGLGVPGEASAVPDCPGAQAPRGILTGQGTLESIAADAKGRLFYTDTNTGIVWRLDGPAAQPKPLTEPIAGALGVMVEPNGSLVVGNGNGDREALLDDGHAGLVRVNAQTGKVGAVITDGFDMSNGIAHGPDGAYYGSNDFGGGVDRFLRGQVTDNWADLQSPNGIVIDKAQRYMYAAQTFKPASVARIELATGRVEPYVDAPLGPDIFGGPDGITRDDADRLYVAVNGLGEIWKVDTDRSICALARGYTFASSLTFGGGGGFPRTSLFFVTFQGQLVELPGVTANPPSPPGPR
jgi:sugar lactone lactonase YvrE